jgi:glycosyltransferase involved in cell wall biosynthesis
MPNIAGLAVVRNESDIIELFVRINLRAVDKVFVIDNKSTDNTVTIIKQLQEEGLPVILWHDSSLVFHQQRIITDAYRRIFAEYDFDWVFALDADEFILGERESVLKDLLNVPKGEYGLLEWRSFVPISERYYDHDSPLWELFRQRAKEPRIFHKVAIPASLSSLCSISMGNHRLEPVDRAFRVKGYVLETRLAHIPVRSSDQMVSKILVKDHKNSLKVSRKEAVSFHIDEYAKKNQGTRLCSGF